MGIMNLTQHAASPEQKEAGVFDLSQDLHAAVKELITFGDIPTQEELKARAADVAAIAADQVSPKAMIGGAGFFMRHLEDALLEQGIQPVHAFSRREVVEKIGSDGEVIKTAIFRHIGFI